MSAATLPILLRSLGLTTMAREHDDTLARAEAEADLLYVRAPIAGVVLDITTQPGEAVTDRGVLLLADTARLMVDAEVYVSDVDRVRVGDRASVTGDGLASPLNGTVTEIVRRMNPNTLHATDPFTYSDLRTVKVRILVAAGQTVSAIFDAQVNVAIQPTCQ